MKSMVALNETNDSVVEFYGNALPPLLLPPSTDYGCCFSCVKIYHIRLYVSVIAFIIYISNTVPCDFLQIDVL